MKNIWLILLAIFFYSTSFLDLSAATRYSDIDAQIFSLQQGFIRDIRSTLKIDTLRDGKKQSGSMSFKTKIDTPEASGALNMQLDEYQTIYDAKTKNVEISYRGMLEFDMFGSKSDYDSYDEEAYSYKKIPFEFHTTVKFNVKAIIVADGSMYISLSELTTLSRGNPDIKKEFDSSLLLLQKYIGRTYKIPASATQSGNMESLVMQKNIINSLDILEKNALFTTISRTGESYTMNLNRATMKKLGWKINKKPTDIVTYTSLPNGWSIRIAEKKNPKYNFITLTEKNGVRILDMGVKSIWGKNGKLDMKMRLSQEKIYFSFKDKSASFLIDWNEGKLNTSISHISPSKYDTTPSFDIAITGDLPMDGSHTNLVISWGGRNIGSLIGKKVWNIGDYRLNMNVILPVFSILIDISGKYIDEIGSYQVLPPTIYELLWAL